MRRAERSAQSSRPGSRETRLLPHQAEGQGDPRTAAGKLHPERGAFRTGFDHPAPADSPDLQYLVGTERIPFGHIAPGTVGIFIERQRERNGGSSGPVDQYPGGTGFGKDFQLSVADCAVGNRGGGNAGGSRGTARPGVRTQFDQLPAERRQLGPEKHPAPPEHLRHRMVFHRNLLKEQRLVVVIEKFQAVGLHRNRLDRPVVETGLHLHRAPVGNRAGIEENRRNHLRLVGPRPRNLDVNRGRPDGSARHRSGVRPVHGAAKFIDRQMHRTFKGRVPGRIS